MLPELPVAQLRHFLLVADLRSFHAAADKAFRSQPAVSKSIAALEARLGAELFEPRNRTVLTPFGRACLPFAREMLRHHDRMLETMAAMARKEMGRLVVAVIGSLAANWMPELVRHFLADYPGVSIRIFDDNSENVERMVLSGEVDFGIASPISTTPQLTFTPLVEDRFGLVCHRSHPLADQRSLRWDQLTSLPLIRTTAHRQLAGTPEARYLENSMMEVTTVFTLFSMIHAGVAMAVFARLAVPALAADHLAFVPLVARRRTRTIGIMRLAGQSLSPVAQEMERRLTAYAAKVPGGLPAARKRR